MSKLRGTRSSNLTRFQLNRLKFVFFKRGGWEPFDRQKFGYLYIKCGLIFEKKNIAHILQLIIGMCFTKKTHFWHSRNEKYYFYSEKKKTFFCNIVRHSKMHACAKYEVIWRNYAVNMAITSVIWPESHESS